MGWFLAFFLKGKRQTVSHALLISRFSYKQLMSDWGFGDDGASASVCGFIKQNSYLRVELNRKQPKKSEIYIWMLFFFFSYFGPNFKRGSLQNFIIQSVDLIQFFWLFKNRQNNGQQYFEFNTIIIRFKFYWLKALLSLQQRSLYNKNKIKIGTKQQCS